MLGPRRRGRVSDAWGALASRPAPRHWGRARRAGTRGTQDQGTGRHLSRALGPSTALRAGRSGAEPPTFEPGRCSHDWSPSCSGSKRPAAAACAARPPPPPQSTLWSFQTLLTFSLVRALVSLQATPLVPFCARSHSRSCAPHFFFGRALRSVTQHLCVICLFIHFTLVGKELKRGPDYKVAAAAAGAGAPPADLEAGSG